MTAKTSTAQCELLDQAAETYFQAVKSGLKLQEEMTARWSKTIKDSLAGNGGCEHLQADLSKVTAQARANADQVLKMMDQSSQDCLDLLGKAFAAGRATTPTEAQGALQQLWETSLKTLNTNAQTMVQTNARIMQEWAEFVKKNATGVVGKPVAAAK